MLRLEGRLQRTQVAEAAGSPATNLSSTTLFHDARRGPNFRLQPPSGEVRQSLGVGEGAVLVGHALVAEPLPLFFGAITGPVQHGFPDVLVYAPPCGQLAGLPPTARVTGALPIPPWASDMPPPQPQMPPGKLGHRPPTSSWGDESAASARSPNLPLRPAAPTPASGGPRFQLLRLGSRLVLLHGCPALQDFRHGNYRLRRVLRHFFIYLFFSLSSVSRTQPLIPRTGHHCGKRACHPAK